jgi:hypothetical protein
MSWTYSGDPSASELDQVRFYCQDVDETRQLVTNEEIAFLLEEWRDAKDSPLYVAAVVAEAIAAKFVGEVDVSADGVSVSQGSLFERYNALAASLRDQYKARYEAAGPDLSELLSTDHDPSIAPLSFGIGFQDNFGAGKQDYGDRMLDSATEQESSRW